MLYDPCLDFNLKSMPNITMYPRPPRPGKEIPSHALYAVTFQWQNLLLHSYFKLCLIIINILLILIQTQGGMSARGRAYDDNVDIKLKVQSHAGLQDRLRGIHTDQQNFKFGVIKN